MNNYIVIQEFMITELGLKGNELLIYACIYGFSQTEGQSFRGSLSYLGKWAGIKERRNVLPPLKSLIDKGLIEKQDRTVNGVKFCEYAAKYNGVVKSRTGCCEIHNGCSENHNGGVVKSRTNNILDIIEDNIKDNIEPPTPFADEVMNELLDRWIRYRKEIKKTLKQTSIDTLVANIKKDGITAEQFESAINKSMQEGWQGLFFDKKPNTNKSIDRWLKA